MLRTPFLSTISELAKILLCLFREVRFLKIRSRIIYLTLSYFLNNIPKKEAGLLNNIFLLFLSATRLSPFALRGWWGSFINTFINFLKIAEKNSSPNSTQSITS
jgi:hypothetical protein